MKGQRSAMRVDPGRVFLALAMGVSFTMSTVSLRSGAADPWHDHIVLGAHGPREWAHALASHHHGFNGLPLLVFGDPQPVPRGHVSPGGQLRVFSVGGSIERASPSILVIGPQVVNHTYGATKLPAPDPGALVPPGIVQRLTPFPVPVPDPPPWTASQRVSRST